MKKIISTDKAPSAIGAYSQGVSFDNLFFTSGQIPLNPRTGKLIEGNFKVQVKQVLENLCFVMKAAGCSIENIMKITVYLVDLNDYQDLNEVFNDYFINSLPARSVVQVLALPMEAKLEIDAIGFIDK